MDLDAWTGRRPAGLAVLAVAGLAATGLALTPLPVELPGSPDLGADPAGAGQESAARLESLDADPIGRHRLRVQVTLATAGEEPRRGIEVQVEALDDGGQVLGEARRGPVTLPAQGIWSGTLALEAPGLVGNWERTPVTAEAGHRRPALP